MDLVRAILNEVEEKLPAIGPMANRVTVEGYDSATIDGHIEIMIEAGLLKGKGLGAGGIMVTGLPWAGHDFIGAAKDNTIWAKAKGSILKHGSSISFDLLLEWLKAEGRQRFGL
jgi:Hypothetical protein (DUF2513)